MMFLALQLPFKLFWSNLQHVVNKMHERVVIYKHVSSSSEAISDVCELNKIHKLCMHNAPSFIDVMY